MRDSPVDPGGSEAVTFVVRTLAEAIERAKARMGLTVAVDRRIDVREETSVRLGVLKAKNRRCTGVGTGVLSGDWTRRE